MKAPEQIQLRLSGLGRSFYQDKNELSPSYAPCSLHQFAISQS